MSAYTGRNELSENVKGRIKGIAKDVVNTEENNWKGDRGKKSTVRICKKNYWRGSKRIYRK